MVRSEYVGDVMDLFEITRTCTANGEHRTETAYVVATGMVQALQVHAQRFTFDGRVLSIRCMEADVVIEEPSEPADAVSQIGFRVEDDDAEA